MPLRNGERVRDIMIALHKQGELPWITLMLEGIEVNEAGEIVTVNPVKKQVVRRADQIATMLVTVTDPVTSEEVTVSGAGAQEIVRRLAIDLIGEEFGTTYDPTVGGSGKAMYD